MRILFLQCALLLLFVAAGPTAAKTLVFCSEGNPEALNPQIVTTTTGMNAGRPVSITSWNFFPVQPASCPALRRGGRFPRMEQNILSIYEAE
jgi:dipeptide transport system substrate-binding protein